MKVSHPAIPVLWTRAGLASRTPNGIRRPKTEPGLRTARSVLACGGPLPLSQTGRTLAALCFLLSALCFRTTAQSFSIPWHTTDGGGGVSTGGVYTVRGTIGQADAGGPLTGGSFSLTGGFWVLPTAIQTPDAPTLTIVAASPGLATISWSPATGTNWILQERLSLSAGDWTNSPTGWANPVTVPAAWPAKFYRLFKP